MGEHVEGGGEAKAGSDRLVSALLRTRVFQELARRIDAGERPLVGGVHGGLLSLLVTGLLRSTDRRIFVLVPGEDEAEGVWDDLRFLGCGGAGARLLRGGQDARGDRVRVLADMNLGADGARVVVCSARAVVDPVPTPEGLLGARLRFAVGATLPQQEVLARLLDAGFERESVVERAGTFSVRGDLVDFFPADQERPLRVEWLDDQIDGIRSFDPASQISVAALREVSPVLMEAGGGREDGCVADHLDERWLILARQASALNEALETHLRRYEGYEVDVRREAWQAFRLLPEVMTTRLKAPPSEATNLGGQVVAPSGTTFESAVETLERITAGKAFTLVVCDSEAERDRFLSVLKEAGGKVASRLHAGSLAVEEGRVHEGWHSPFLGLAALSHHELFATPTRRRRPKQDDMVVSQAIESFLDLDEGDYVVHLAHGLARFEGLRREKKGEGEQDFLVLRFRDDVMLHVPASKIELVQKYIGGKGEGPELSRLGSGSWEKRKDAVQKAVMDLAADLLEFQALRAQKAGIRHAADTPWQQEFEAAFPYQATPDQARAAEAIKDDMESSRPMDRLICGDVGYGKTEVAMRAAFKCVMGNRQVAVLVPTTVLAEQHWHTFRERMRDYPIVVESLSRFRTRGEQKEVLEGLAAGAVDIVIGTHRLVQGDVAFKDLGLLIIDEEQRFGVAHKEKLKRLRLNVDVLVMSATPIPRTLHQAILGIRDISPLGQAPRGRQQVHSEVTPYDDGLVRSAILRELDREGQVFFVHNRVQTIYKMAKRIQELVPEARIVVGHGQMPERALERAMVTFVEGKADVLVATTIIESGLDIPRANTIFVDQAEIYGLSDLHQLRGRVGRYHHQAHAYFLVRPEASLSDVAEKRLRAIEEFSRLGAGFQIAMRDMEIRGAGNILGPEQSGHIAAVGYDLYCRLLEQAVKQLKHERIELPEEVELNIDFSAYLPESFIPDRKLRVEMYRKLGRATTEEQFEALVREMEDRFGPPPEVAGEFVLVARIRALMERVQVARLEIMRGEGVALHARRLSRLKRWVTADPEAVRILAGRIVLLVHPKPFRSPGELLGFLAHSLGGNLPAS